ncbi:MAG: helix-turn-helix transcriptional regulator [Verrucomicrobia bacterium]|nr:helix-turn-helix transcriptional regulator [Verrucomicrobiota bacterium]
MPTPREQAILALVARGLDDKTIAAHLGLTHGSVRNRLTTLYRKLGVTSRTAAALTTAASTPPIHPPPDESGKLPRPKSSCA